MSGDLLAYQVGNATLRLISALRALVVEPRAPEKESRLPAMSLLFLLVVAAPFAYAISGIVWHSIKTVFHFVCGSLFILGLAVAVDFVFYQSSGVFPWLL